MIAGLLLIGASLLPTSTALAASPTPTLLTSLPDPPISDAGYGGDGYNVAISGDTAVVIAVHTDVPAGASGFQEDNGAAFVYVRHGAKWPSTPTATLDAPSSPGGQFGTSVAISGPTIVIGDPLANSDPRLSNSGEAYIYVRGSGGWPSTPTATLDDPGGQGDDAFGETAAVSGNTILVGAPGSGPTGYGIAYEYTKGPTEWPTTPTTTLPDPTGHSTNKSNDAFGVALALSGTTMVIASVGQFGVEDPVVYGYIEGTAGWPLSPSFTVRPPTPKDLCFGIVGGLALSQDTLLISGCQNGQPDSPRVYLYSKEQKWVGSPTVTISSTRRTPIDLLNPRIAISGRTFVIGSDGTGDGRPGSVYVFAKGNAGIWPVTPSATILDPQGTQGDAFGCSVAVSGKTAIFGAVGADPITVGSDLLSSGTAYVYAVD